MASSTKTLWKFFSLQTFGKAEEGKYTCIHELTKNVQPLSFESKDKSKNSIIRGIMFADNAAVAAHIISHLQSLMYRFASACTAFGLTISLKKTKFLAQVTISPKTTINNY